MSTLSEFMAQSARQGKAREKRHARLASLGPVVVLKGWREGMEKVSVTLLLRDCGIPLSEAYEATNTLLKGNAATVRLPEGVDADALRADLDRLGVIV